MLYALAISAVDGEGNLKVDRIHVRTRPLLRLIYCYDLCGLLGYWLSDSFFSINFHPSRFHILSCLLSLLPSEYSLYLSMLASVPSKFSF